MADETGVQKIISLMLRRQCSYISFTRIGRDDPDMSVGAKSTSDYTLGVVGYPISDEYLRHLQQVLGEEGIHAGIYGELSKVFVIGEADGSADKARTLVELVSSCPDGKILDSINEQFSQKDKDFGTHDKKFYRQLRFARKQGRKILTLEYGPIVYTASQLKDIQRALIEPAFEREEILID